MSWKFWNRKMSVNKRMADMEIGVSVEIVRLRKVVNLIPEYMDALIDERMGARAKAEGLDGRELHGPAERKLKKVEARIAEILGTSPKTQQLQKGLTCAEQRKVFLGAMPGAIRTDEQMRDMEVAPLNACLFGSRGRGQFCMLARMLKTGRGRRVLSS